MDQETAKEVVWQTKELIMMGAVIVAVISAVISGISAYIAYSNKKSAEKSLNMTMANFESERKHKLYAQLKFIKRDVANKSVANAKLVIKHSGQHNFLVEKLEVFGTAQSDRGDPYNLATPNKIDFADAIVFKDGESREIDVRLIIANTELVKATVFVKVIGLDKDHNYQAYRVECGLQDLDNIKLAN